MDSDCIVVTDAIGRLKSLHHKLLHDGRVKPCCAQSDVNFRSLKVFGLSFGQRVHVDLEFRMTFHGELCHAQLVAHIAGQILVCGLPSCFRVIGIRCGVFEDDAGQLDGDALIVARSSQQLLHVG